jgi:thiol:disulfide interchange protein
MLRRLHLVVGILAVVAFLLSGQVMSHHHPRTEQMSGELRMMYVSRHIYLLAAALVNTVLGLYLHVQASSWRRGLQWVGSLLILFSVFSVSLAFAVEPPLGLAGRGWRSLIGLIALFVGVMTHLVANAGARTGSA